MSPFLLGSLLSVAAFAPAEADLFEVAVVDGKARVFVPVRAQEDEAWNKAAEGSDAFPERLEVMRPDTFVLPGKTQAPGAFVGYETDGGGSESWWVMVFEAEGLGEASGVAVIGELPDPKLRAAKPIKLTEERVAAVQTVLDEKLSRGARRKLGKKVLSKSRVTMIDGTFADGGTTLVAVNVPMRGYETFISALFTLDVDGDLATVIRAPKVRMDRYDPSSAGDLDGDGLDDILFRASYSEGGFTVLTRWDEGAPHTVMLAGDGA